MSENFDKVYDYVRENNIWDNVYMDITEDEDGNTYIIFDSNEGIREFNQVVQDVLEIEDDNFNPEDVLEVEYVYSDEYTTCSDCNKIIRTEPNSYHWQPDYYMGDGFIVCNKCFNDNEEYQDDYIMDKINNPKSAINGLIDEQMLEHLGFKKLDEEYESGWYHKEDSPEEIYEKLSHKYSEIIFLINNVEQFRINFVTFVRFEIESEEE